MSSPSFHEWARWQLPYAAHSYAYIPITLTKRVLLRGRAGVLGLEPAARRFWDKWGFFSPELIQFARGPVWIHLSSGGEVLIGWGLLKQLGASERNCVFATEGYDSFELLTRSYGSHRTFFAPSDVKMAVRAHLHRIGPRALLFVQNAYTPVLLREARRQGTPTILVNGLMRANSGNIHMQRSVGLGFHRNLDAIAVPHESDFKAFRDLGVSANRMEIVGDIYADLRHLRLDSAERAALRRQLGFRDEDRVVIFGSTHEGEEPVVREALDLLRLQKLRGVRFIIAPRQPQESGPMAERFRAGGWRVALKSRLGEGSDESRLAHDLLITDTFGELARLYGVADVAYIGASLVPLNERRAGHNVLEPLVHGVVPIFGPHMNLWNHVTDRLLEVEPSLRVDSAEMLAERIRMFLDGAAPHPAIWQISDEFMQRQGGAVERTVTFVKERIQW